MDSVCSKYREVCRLISCWREPEPGFPGILPPFPEDVPHPSTLSIFLLNQHERGIKSDFSKVEFVGLYIYQDFRKEDKKVHLLFKNIHFPEGHT
jgi:hypothetical protein